MLPEQAPGAGSIRATPADGTTHSLADRASQAKHGPTSSHALTSASAGKDQPAGSSSSRQPVDLSEELVDLFNSIQQLQQEVASLPQPQQIWPAAGAQSGPSSHQVPHFLIFILFFIIYPLIRTAAFLYIHV